MEIAEQLTKLAELSNIELKIRDKRDRLEVVPKLAKDAEDEAATKATAVEVLDRKRFDKDRERQAKEKDLQGERDHLRKWNARLDKIRDDREHAALQSEIGTLKRVIGRLENDILERMQEIEDIDKDMAKAKDVHAAAQTHAQEEWSKVQEEVATLEGELKELEASRTKFTEGLPAALVNRYRKIADKRQGQGVALIKGETCSACNTVLPPQLCLQVWKGVVLEGCPSCSRILVHEEMTRSTTAEQAQQDGAPA